MTTLEIVLCVVILLTWRLMGPIIELYSARQELKESRERRRAAQEARDELQEGAQRQ